MTIRRYERTPVIGLNFRYGTSYAIPVIRAAVENGSIRTKELILLESERLDILAGKEYGDGSLFWIIGAASNIGWCLQVPAGTRILIPSLKDIADIVG
jgi:hypothetical protein